MATRMDRTVRRNFDTLFDSGVIRDLTDGQLLERYATDRGEAAELAFAALVERHGPMVLRVCRARLSDPHEALDAFQATFLVLIRKSHTLWVKDSLGPWLHQVAYRTACCARTAAVRRRRLEREAAELVAVAAQPDPGLGPGWEQSLHEEINRLPERYRIPIVLCDLEGLTCEDVARRMGRPIGTVKSWRARGRERLRQRLIRSGLMFSTGSGGALAADVARASIPRLEAEEAARLLSNHLSAGVVPATVHLLAQGVLKAMVLTKLRTASAAICAMVFLAAGIGTAMRVAAEDPKASSEQAPGAPAPPAPRRQVPPATSTSGRLADETWPLSLRDAIRMGLKSSKLVRVHSRDVSGGPVPPSPQDDARSSAGEATFVIAPARADLNPLRFKAEVMALARSIEQRYWDLAQAYVQVWASEKAAEVGEDVLRREQADQKGGRGTEGDVGEAQQRLEQLRLNTVVKMSDVANAECRLREVLGLPPSDHWRIIPSTIPLEAKLEPDWDASLAEMLQKHPSIARERTKAEAQSKEYAADLDEVARTFLPDVAGRQTTAPRAATERRKLAALGSTSLQQTTHEATHALARTFLEVDASYKQYQIAKKHRAAAAERLEAQRTYYEEGRITVDRFHDALAQYASLMAQEALYKANYNNAIVALEEAKGTLLEHDQITVAVSEKNETSRHAEALAGRANGAAPTPARVSAVGRTISFQVTFKAGPTPVELRGSLTIGPAGADDGGRGSSSK